jgi:hypothetical protein
VEVRCPQCAEAVSEWAAFCPGCGAALDDAELIDVAPESTHPDASDAQLQTGHADRTLRRSRAVLSRARMRVAVAVGLVVATVVTVALVGTGESGGSRAALPADLVAERLFIADPARTGVFRADGTPVDLVHDLPGEGYPSLAIESGSGLVVFVHDAQAYEVPSLGVSPPERVGDADQIFPADKGAVGLFVGGPLGPGFVEYMSFDGVVPEPGTGSSQLSSGTVPVARLPDGLLVRTPSQSPNGPFQLTLMSNRGTEQLGLADQMIGTSGTEVAWLSCASVPKSCTLVLDDTATDERQVIEPPTGYSTFVPGGGFSPDGRLLAAFAASSTAADKGTLRLTTVSTVGGRGSVIGPKLKAGPSGGTAAWSQDGRWLYFGGASGYLYAQRLGVPIGPSGPFRLPIRSSYAVTGL